MKTNSLIELLLQHKVVIPPIQRDYAQGRSTGKIPHIRERFLNSIFDTLADDQRAPLELDFIYGYTDKDKTGDHQEVSTFKPLDGQQRLTTLFLLHWYFAKKEAITGEQYELLSKFSYATRLSSKRFIEELAKFNPELGSDSIDDHIKNQPWFFSSWLNDPTIVSMLVILREIENRSSDMTGIWHKLTGENPRIIFHLLPMEDLGLPDDLYIKMNSRGKELTDFEHFKSQFSDLLEGAQAKVFTEKIDKEWSDLFWDIFKEKNVSDIAKEVDGGFLSFFWFVTNILIAKNKIETIDEEYWLSVIKKVYYKKTDNVDFLFYCLNLFQNIEKSKNNYFEDLFYVNEDEFGVEKTRLYFSNPQPNLFRKCAETYGYYNKSNGFSVGEQLLLYGIIYANRNEIKGLNQKIRRLRNLFSSSEDQLRNEYLSTFLYEDVEAVIHSNALSVNSKLSKRQLDEEEVKDKILFSNPTLKEVIYKLEDHPLLRGNVSIFNFDKTLPNYAKEFHRIFTVGCDYLRISLAMLTIGDYSQEYGRLKRFGNRTNSTWRQLFTQSDYRKGFEQTKNVLNGYLSLFQQEDKVTDRQIIDEYLRQFENNPILPRDWRYYYIKYESFKYWGGNQTDGYYSWNDIKNAPYECTMLFRTQFNGRHWSPFLLALSNLSPKNYRLENYGSDLQYTDGELILLLKNINNGFSFNGNDDYSKGIIVQLINEGKLNSDGVMEINQTEDGFDLEDRIEKANNWLQSLSPIRNA